MNLVVGATGTLGGEICRLLGERRKAVRAVVAAPASPDTATRLKSLGAELVRGDLKDKESLTAACRGASAVISTASSTVSRQEGDSIETVARQGQLALIEAAAAAQVRHFIFISFPTVDLEFPLQSAKRAVEQSLRRSGMPYTILQPTFFVEVWLGPALGVDVGNGKAQGYGTGEKRMSWMAFQDVAQFAVAAVDNPQA